jgi:TolB-like protein/predicted Ser/Thr protein kinase
VLFAELADASPEERATELASVGDPALAAEITRLLAAHDEVSAAESGFLGDLNASPVKALIDDGCGLPEVRIGRYPVVRRLGQGGMGVVYLAHDPRLDRPVAIKLLPPHLGGDAKAVQRLATEARTASALDHPNIATVHEIAETDDGRTFIAMAYYCGETLRERLSRGPLAVDEAIDIGIQLAEGLGAAHRAGIVHRDIKPENVLITGEGRVVILDFGIAKAAGAALITSGLLRGTAAYMSPEQSRGESSDPRTDVWSTGVMLHELLTGSRPFPGEGSALVHAIREDPPAPLAPGRSGVPPGLAELVRQCLAKVPGSRLRSAGELAAGLRAIRDGRMPQTPWRRRRLVAIAGAGLAAVTALAVYEGWRADPSLSALAGTTTVAAPGIAVLPFEVRGRELLVWREGMVDLLAANLDGVEGLRGIDSRTVLASWARRIGNGHTSDLASSLAVARDVGAQFAVVGTMVPNGSDLRLAVRVHAVPGGADLAAFSVDGPADSLFALVDRVTIKVLAAVWQGRMRPDTDVNLGRITTASLPALKAFLNGERRLRQGDYAGAVADYRDAVLADSTFPFAYYRLSTAQVWIGDTEDSAFTWQRSLAEALRLAQQLPERERLLVRLASARTVNALQTILDLAETTVARYPDEVDAWYLLAETYYHSGDQLLIPPHASDTALQRALALDPAMAMLYEHLIHNALNESPDSARVRGLLDPFRQLAPRHRSRPMDEAFTLAFGDSVARHQALVRLSQLSDEELAETIWPLYHRRYWHDMTLAIESHVRSPTFDDPWLMERLVRLSVDRGDMERASRYFAYPLLAGWYRALNAYRARLGRAPVPDSTLRAQLALPRAGVEEESGLRGFQLAVAAAVAAEEGRWSDHEAALARLTALAQLARARNDSAIARYVNGSVLALRGRALSLRGDQQRALTWLVAGQQQATWSESVAAEAWNAIIRWWIGDLLLAQGRLEDAARYFSSIRHDPYAAERVAPIYQRLGRNAQAREAYVMVAEAWQDAHPALQLRAAAARAAAARLAAEAQGARTPTTGVSPLGTAAGTVRN